MKDSGALPDDLCLNYVRLDFANNNDNTSFSRHLSHKKIIVMMMMMMMTMMTRMLMMIATMMMLIMMATNVEKNDLAGSSLMKSTTGTGRTKEPWLPQGKTSHCHWSHHHHDYHHDNHQCCCYLHHLIIVAGREDGSRSKLDQSHEMGGFTCQEVWMPWS